MLKNWMRKLGSVCLGCKGFPKEICVTVTGQSRPAWILSYQEKSNRHEPHLDIRGHWNQLLEV